MNQRPRSTSAQRCCRTDAARAARRPQIGHLPATSATARLLDDPCITGPRAILAHRERPAGVAREFRQRQFVVAERGCDRWRRVQRGTPGGARHALAPAARNAARPAACGPARRSCSGGCTRGAQDFRQAQRGEAEKLRLQRVGRQRRGEIGRQRAAALGGQAREVDYDRPGQTAQPDLRGERRQQRAVGFRCAAALPRRCAVAAPRSTSMAVSAGVG